jgi:type I restriction enzyme R subunit
VSHPYSEDALELATLGVLESLGWEVANGYSEGKSPTEITGRENLGEVLLPVRLVESLRRLNPGLAEEAIERAVEVLAEDRSVMTLARGNKDFYRLLKDGVKVPVDDEEGGEAIETVRVIDWAVSEANDFYAVRQLWVSGPEGYKRRTDVVGFVNGIPLVLLELKASHKNLETGYSGNISDYKDTVTQLFWPNALVIVSNGSDARVGSVSAFWEHFSEWKKINSEGEMGVVSLETMVKGVCEPNRLLDLVENFTVFQEMRGGLVKMVAKNHQYLGVNNAIEALHDIEGRQGRLGVFWHTQGSGKSLSMLFFTQKVLRKVQGNWTFVVVTDRKELDDQIYKTFQDTGAVTEGHVQADSGEHLRQLLTQDHRYVFTLIHKFHTEPGERYPTLSTRDDIIVLTDEAHRTQYDVLALNMRNALPNASFLGFTGTPLIAEEQKTREVFGDYVSIYDFKASIDDGATVPLYYENRIPELQLVKDFTPELDEVLEQAEIDEAQERKLAREFSREYHLITREDRLNRIALDLVDHFMGRGFPGKAMVVSIDKSTAVRMYDKVQEAWTKRIADLKAELATAGEDRRKLIQDEIDFMEETDMAVVVSQSQGEIEEMQAKGIDIKPHRERMVNEDLETKFKDPDDPFRIAFVCAMWMTGFDVPACSTIYLDRPMKNHTLMQTIARANRVWGEKQNGLIVDYIGVFRDLQRALAIYGSGLGGTAEESETPVQAKDELVAALRTTVDDAVSFCAKLGISIQALISAKDFEFIAARDDAVELILVTPDTKAQFLHKADQVNRLFKAILPDKKADEFGPYRAVFVNVAEKIRSDIPKADISEVMGQVEKLLDESVAARAYVIRAAEVDTTDHIIDLSQIDFDALAEHFNKTKRKRTEAEKLKGLLSGQIVRMVRVNPTRMDYMERFQALIDEYNAGSINVEEFFKRLLQFTKELTEEDQRAISEGLSEEELAIFDLLTQPEIQLTEKQVEEVKAVAHDLLEKLKLEKLVLDWRKKQQSRASVKVTIEEELDRLPDVFSIDLYREKVERLYQHIYDSYFGEGRSVYSAA